MNKSYELFLLMLKLSQLNGFEQALTLFLEAMNEAFPGCDFKFLPDGTADSEAIPIATIRRRFGFLSVRSASSPLDATDKTLVVTAAAMLAVVLERGEHLKLVSDEKLRLDDLVAQRSEALLAQNLELEHLNKELTLQIEARRKAELERDRLFTVSLDMLCVAGFDGYFKQINPAWSRALGWSNEQLLSKPWIDLVHPDDRAQTEGAHAVLVHGHPVVMFENRYRCSDGSYRWLAWNSFPSESDGLIFAICRDITDRRAHEEQQRQAEKMQAIGQLAGGIAHDFNNQLSGILGFADLLREDLADQPSLARQAEAIITSAQRAADITRQLLAFARKGQFRRQTVDLNKIATEVATLLERSIDKKIRVRVVLHAAPATTLGDPSQIQNAVLNLALNARDAMAGKGEIRIDTSVRSLQRIPAELADWDLAAGDYACLTVSDSGAGMTEETRKHIYEPFYSTKPKGTGMGLPAVYGTMRGHKGGITVDSTVGVGTAVTLYFGLEQPQVVEPRVAPSQRPKSHGEHVLVIDDEEVVCSVTTSFLNRLNYRVTTFCSGIDAIRFYHEQWRTIDLVILDMIMPVKSGAEVFTELQAIHPGVKVLLCSGYSLDDVAREVIHRGALGFLNKPFDRTMLETKLTEIMHR